jgi:hypothetical protein
MTLIRNILLASCLFVPVGFLYGADEAAGKSEAKPAESSKRELSAELTALRDQVRQTLEMHRKDAFNTQNNLPTEIMHYSLAYGCGTEVALATAQGQQAINGITCLCWNYPCAGYEMLGRSQKRLAPSIGYGSQERPGEFLAMLAMSRVQTNYPVRVAKDTRTVADLVEAEKLGCRSGTDQSLKLIGLSYFVEEPEWKNDLGETWSIERMVQEELAQPVVSAPEGGLNRLMGLSCAVAQREKHKQPIDGQFKRAQAYIDDFHTFALQLQNADGSWGPNFLAARSNSGDAATQLRSTGRVLEWLAVSLPANKLQNAQVLKSVEYVAGLLAGQRYQWNNTPMLSTREIASVGHALHGLMVYDQRAFKPFDPVEKPSDEKKAPEAASRDKNESKAR